MFTVDIPYVPVQDTPIVLAQAATTAAGGATSSPDYLLKTCMEVSSSTASRAVPNLVDAAGMLVVQIGNREHRYIDPATATVKLILLENAKHGELVPETSGSGWVSYTYSSKPGYLGKDEAVFLAEFQGKRYKVVVNLVVSKDLIENPLTSDMTPVCPEPQLIKIKSKPSSGSPGYDLNPIITIADLPGTAVGQTTANTITLDTDAAGYGWFADSTPYENDER